MNTDKHILDNPERAPKVKNKLKSRVPSDLMIVIGILLVILGLICLYLFVDLIYAVSTSDLYQIITWTNSWFLRAVVLAALLFLFGLNLIIGGVGLIRHLMLGWILSLSAAVFSVILPVLITVLKLFLPQSQSLIPSWLAMVYILFFGLILWFLVSRTIRNFYSPSTKSYGIAGIIVFVLSSLFIATVLLI